MHNVKRFLRLFRLHIAQQKAVHFGDLALFSKCGIWYNKSVRACEASGPCADAARVRHGYGAQLAGPDITDDTSELQLSVIFAVGCDKVNCGNAAREGALGYDLGAPHVNSSAIWYPVGAVIDRPRNGKWVRFVNRLHHTNHLSTQNVMITPVVGEQCSPLRLCVGKSFTRCAEVGAPYGKAI